MSMDYLGGYHYFIILDRQMEAAGEASEPAQEFLECGLCFENDELKRLPCNPGHIYCITCLTKNSEQTEILKCPLCR